MSQNLACLFTKLSMIRPIAANGNDIESAIS